MISYELSSDLTREEFHGLVTNMYCELTKHDIDPPASMIIGDRDEILDDGTTLTHFSLILSEQAAKILEQKEL
jgi:hypothetical protein